MRRTWLHIYTCMCDTHTHTHTHTHHKQESFFGSDAAMLGQPRTLGWIADLYLFRHLVSLSLSDNCLDQFPLSLCSLKTLQELDISSNNLRSVPQEIQNLTKWAMTGINTGLSISAWFFRRGKSAIFQYFSTILYVHFRNSRKGKSTSRVEIHPLN